MEQAQNFFEDRKVIVQGDGLEEYIYRLNSYIQSGGSAILVSRTLSSARLAGVSGLQVFNAQPLMYVSLPLLGSMFCYGCATLFANNTMVAKFFNTGGDVLALPMKCLEVTWNAYGNPVIHKTLGIPVILNLTQTFKTGTGYTLKEVAKYIPMNKTSLVRSIKNKLIQWLN